MTVSTKEMESEVGVWVVKGDPVWTAVRAKLYRLTCFAITGSCANGYKLRELLGIYEVPQAGRHEPKIVSNRWQHMSKFKAQTVLGLCRAILDSDGTQFGRAASRSIAADDSMPPPLR